MRRVQKWVPAVGVALVLLALSFPGAAHEGAREATYIGSTNLDHELNEECAEAFAWDECIMQIPTMLIWVGCDGEGGPWLGGPYDGVGGAMFCDIARGSTLTLTVDDAVVDMPEAFVGCRGHDGGVDDHSTEIVIFAYLEGSLTLTVPGDCDSMTDLMLFHVAGTATTGTAYLEFEG